MAEDPMLQMATQAQQRARETKREEILSNSPTAQYMQGRQLFQTYIIFKLPTSRLTQRSRVARIEVLTKMLIRRFGDVLEVAITPPPKPEDPDPPSLVDTANKQLTVDTATMSLIRAAEELMVLTRTMKELWLLGGLDTLVADQNNEEKEKRRKMKEDENTVVKGMLEWLEKNGSRFGEGSDESAAVKEEVDVEMVSD